jgi:hypothetical protein
MTMTDQTPEVWTTEQTEDLLSRVKDDRIEAMKEQGLIAPIVLAKAMDVRPQMVYNRIRDNKLPAHLNSTGKFVVKWSDAVEFAHAYFTRKAEKQAKIESELRGES